MCLDAGIDGVIFSTIETREQAETLIEYCNYPCNRGVRGCALTRENKWGDGEIGKRKPTIIGQIETKKGVDNISQIFELPFDKFVIGPYDLSTSLGCPADWNNPLYVNYMNTIYKKVPQERLGAFLPSKKDIEAFYNSKRNRPSLLIWGLDVNFLMEGIKDLKT